MDRKNFFKSACGLGLCSCAGFGVFANNTVNAAIFQDKTDDKQPTVKADAEQIQKVLQYVESSMDPSVKDSIFERLGHEHTTKESFKKWISAYKSDINSFFIMVNSNKDTYWEKMEYDKDKSAIVITGKPVDRCVCAYAQLPDPPKSLCTHCCKNFQKSMFEMLLDKPVRVQIDEAFLLGDKRCSTTIFVDGGLELKKA